MADGVFVLTTVLRKPGPKPKARPLCQWCGLRPVAHPARTYCSRECFHASLTASGTRHSRLVRITKAVLETAYANGYRPLEDVGREFGITRERVRQLVKKYGIQTHRPPRVDCEVCGKRLHRGSKTKRCQKHQVRTFVNCICGHCGQPFQLTPQVYRARFRPGGIRRGPRTTPLFCSKRCSGAWTAEHYGWGSPNETPQQVAARLSAPKTARGPFYPQDIYKRRAMGLCLVHRDTAPEFFCQQPALPGSTRCADHPLKRPGRKPRDAA